MFLAAQRFAKEKLMEKPLSLRKIQAQHTSMRQIGERLERDAGTISRELFRNVSSTGEYKPHLAQRYY